MLHRATCRQSCIRSIMPHSYSLSSSSTVSWKVSVVSFANRRGFHWHFEEPMQEVPILEIKWMRMSRTKNRGIEPIGNRGVGFSWNRHPNTFFRNHTMSYANICALLWLNSSKHILIDRYNYSTLVSRNLPFSNHVLSKLVLLLRQATGCLYFVLLGNELALLSPPSPSRLPSSFSMMLPLVLAILDPYSIFTSSWGSLSLTHTQTLSPDQKSDHTNFFNLYLSSPSQEPRPRAKKGRVLFNFSPSIPIPIEVPRTSFIQTVFKEGKLRWNGMAGG